MNLFQVFGFAVLVHVTFVTFIAVSLIGVARNRSAYQHAVGVIGLLLTLISPVLALALPESNAFQISQLRKSVPDLKVPYSTNSVSVAHDSNQVLRSAKKVGDIKGIGNHEILKGAKFNKKQSLPEFRKIAIVTMLLNCLFAVWGVGSLLALYRHLRSRRTLKCLSQSSSAISLRCLELIENDVIAALKVGKLPPIRVSELAPIPLVVGVLNPSVILPRGFAESADNEQLRDVLIHECAHIARRDPWVHVLQRAAAILFWVHPGVYWLNQQISRAREELCDNYVIHRGDASRYAETLLSMSELCDRQQHSICTLGLFNSPWTLEKRIYDLLDLKRKTITDTRLVTKLSLAILFVGYSVCVGGIGLERAFTADQPTKNAPETKQLALADKPPLTTKDPDIVQDIVMQQVPEIIEGCIRDQQNQIIAGAVVSVRGERLNENGYPTGEPILGPWTATTDEDGCYSISTDSPQLGPHDVLSINVRADGFVDFEQGRGVGQVLWKTVKIYKARTIQGRILDPDGHPVKTATVRFQANTPDLNLVWDTGPIQLPTTADGSFSYSVPQDGKTAFAIYPNGFAPRVVHVPVTGTEMGDIRVERGIALKGRVIDKQGHPVAGTVVSVRSQIEYLHLFGILIVRAFQTDEQGEFQLPPLHGRYAISVGQVSSDYFAGQFQIGVNPPPIAPQIIDFGTISKTKEILFQETQSIKIRGRVRWSDGTPVKNVEMKAYMRREDWRDGIDLTHARTDDEGMYSLQVASNLPQVCITYPRVHIRAPNGTFKKLILERTAQAPRPSDSIEYRQLAKDVDDVNWVVSP